VCTLAIRAVSQKWWLMRQIAEFVAVHACGLFTVVEPDAGQTVTTDRPDSRMSDEQAIRGANSALPPSTSWHLAKSYLPAWDGQAGQVNACGEINSSKHQRTCPFSVMTKVIPDELPSELCPSPLLYNAVCKLRNNSTRQQSNV
jgi:hypothetical protein